MRDAEALAGCCFYRGVAAPSRAGSYSYVGLINPPTSGVNAFVDAFYPWPGYAGASTEYGNHHYATPFDQAPFQDVYSTFLVCTKYSMPNSKTKIWCGTYSGIVNPQVDYIWQCAPAEREPHLQHFPYPLVIVPGDGIVFWSTYIGHENKVGIWLREKPAV